MCAGMISPSWKRSRTSERGDDEMAVAVGDGWNFGRFTYEESYG